MTDDIDPDDYRYVLGMDPGGTTGIAMLRYTDDTAPELVYLYQQEGGIHGFWNFFGGSQPTDNVDIVSENFTLRQGIHGADVTPLRIEGIQFALWGDEVTYQEPKMKSLVPDAWLKEQNLWTPGRPHQMDGLRHAFVFLRNEMHEPTLKALSEDQETETLAKPGEAADKTLADATEALEEAGDAAEETAKLLKAFSEMFGGEEAERDETEEGGSGQGQGEPGDGDGDGDGNGEVPGQAGDGGYEGEARGGGGRGKEIEDVEAVEATGQRRKRLNGSFSGFDDDED